ncbi:polysaccharide pyruvyl transferase CsaB [Chitinispirillum alkaliphilum]|nr:polysaccharide pyruvyl transferase CsaB [Chitinispirillum alkaliphilum]
MIITVLGWYGTETIGDRGILAGLISFFNRAYGSFELKLGSLYPFFSDRTINEDYSLYKEFTGKDQKIEIFNTKRSKELLNAISCSDLVVMGGGPLMDLNELFMIEYAIKKAKRYGIKTALLGCGVGPLFHKKYRQSVLEIAKSCDIVVLRDSKSKENLADIYREFKVPFCKELVLTSYDPAVECCLFYHQRYSANAQDYITVNLRDFPREYLANKDIDINDALVCFVKDLALKYSEKEIRLIPMHYFHIGNDDRAFLNKIAVTLNLPNIMVQNANLTLKETMETYQNAYFNVGMRFHSIVFQTITSGKNYVLDYTEPGKGKISGFIRDIDTTGFYDDRYLSLQEHIVRSTIIKNEHSQFELPEKDMRKSLDVYNEVLSKV